MSLGYRPGLDSLRAVAVLSVMACHAKIPYFTGGFIGVDMFFTLSGFLITTLLFQEKQKTGRINLSHFYARRALRLLPALFGVLTFLTVDALLHRQFSTLKTFIPTLFYYANWVRAFDLSPLGRLDHTWSLSIEEQFYFLWPMLLGLMLRYVRRDKIPYLIAGGILLSLSLRCVLYFTNYSLSRLYNGLDTRADSLLVGCLLATLLNSGKVGLSSKKWAILASLPLVAFILFSHSDDGYMLTIGYTVVPLLTTVLILYALNSPRLLTLAVPVWIGQVSYGLYLWHYPIFAIDRLALLRGLTRVPAAFALTFVVAGASYYLIEKPCLRLKGRFT